MKAGCGVRAMVLLGLGCMACGCRAHPASLGMMVLGMWSPALTWKSARSNCWANLRPPPTRCLADGRIRLSIWTTPARRRCGIPRTPIWLTVDRWVVESLEGKIVFLTKTRENIDGVEDVVRSVNLRSKVIGNTAAECQRRAALKEPVARFRSMNTNDRVFVYDVRNFTNLRGARYCLLWFDSSDKCIDIKLVGVSASTKKEPLGGNSP